MCRVCAQETSQFERILVTMTIDLDGTNTAQLDVRDSDDPWILANSFLTENGMNPETIISGSTTLAQFLENQIGTAWQRATSASCACSGAVSVRGFENLTWGLGEHLRSRALLPPTPAQLLRRGRNHST